MIASKKRQIILYGLACGVLIFLLDALEYRFVIRSHAFEVYAIGLALIFTALGIWLALTLAKPKIETIIVEKEVPASDFVIDEMALKETGISKRELEVLQLMQQGLSNKEIADRLFVSLNTIKTHTSNLFEKLEVSRRTQAIVKAKELKLIA